MFNLEYSDWQMACNAIHKIEHYKLKNSLQWYPISKINKNQRENISSEDFFNKYIKSGLYRLSENFNDRYKYFLPKEDSNLRNVSLINPLDLYVTIAVGISLNRRYVDKREYLSAFYAGNLNELNITYNKAYDDFYKQTNYLKGCYENFIKIDLQNFYPNINMDMLIQLVLDKCNLNASEGDFLKNYFLYLGGGKFPLIENNATISFLATKIYLEDIDISIVNFLKNFSAITNFDCVRYVDDLYIFFNTSIDDLNYVKNNLVFELSSILNDYNLMYNSNKFICSKCGEIDEVLKKSFYDESCEKIGFDILDMFDKKLIKIFLSKLLQAQKNNMLNYVKFNEILEEVFQKEGVEYSPKEIYRSFCFNSSRYVNDCNEEINLILSNNFDILKIDVNNLIFIILETHNEENIKKLLSKIYTNIRECKFDKFNTKIIIQYLLKRSFANDKFLQILKNQEWELYEFVEKFCLNNFYDLLKSDKFIDLFDTKFYYKQDILLLYLYSMFLFNYKQNNIMLSFGYFSTYFERLTAHIAFVVNHKDKEKKPNYKKYYKKDSMNIIWDKSIIEEFRENRNGIPFIHNDMKEKLLDNSCENIKSLIETMIVMIKNKIFNEQIGK